MKGTTKQERRFIPAIELRVSERAADAAPTIDGYAALFNAPSQDLGGFIETIAPGAFRDAIGKSDIRALFNHDPNFVLGRMSAGTLTVEEDERGLKISNTPPDTQWARDLLTSMRRGDVNQMSFAFAVEDDEWEKKDGIIYRTIRKVAELFDVSPVTYPAYPDTAVAVRSLEQWKTQQTDDSEGSGAEARGGSIDLAQRRLKLALAR